jgi:hypothetical protein
VGTSLGSRKGIAEKTRRPSRTTASSSGSLSISDNEGEPALRLRTSSCKRCCIG